MIFAEIGGGVVVNVVQADQAWADAQPEQFVPLIEPAGIGWLWDGSGFTPPPIPDLIS